MTKKKIAIVSDAAYPFNKGGKEKRINEVSTRLAAQGYEVTIYCMQWWKGGKTIRRDGVMLHAISPYYPLYTKKRRSIKEAVFFALHCLKLIGEEFDILEIDHMPHLALFTTKIVCTFKRKRMIAVWHEVWGKKYWRHYLGIAGVIAYWIERLSAKLPDTIISVSNHTTKNLRNILGVQKDIVTIHNGLDIEAILKNEPAAAGADIIFAGRLLAHKNVDVLLGAIRILREKLPKVSALVIGEGPEKEHLKALAERLDLRKNVSFLNFFENHDELYRTMRASRVFVLPSTREGFGIAALEANACGLPVVTIDHEGNAAKELILNNENGALSLLDEVQLAGAIERTLNAGKDPNVYLQYAQKYDWDKVVAEIRKVYTT